MFKFDLQLFGGRGSNVGAAGKKVRAGGSARSTPNSNQRAKRKTDYSARINSLTAKDIKSAGLSFGDRSIRRAYRGKTSYYQVTIGNRTTNFEGANALKRAKAALLG